MKRYAILSALIAIAVLLTVALTLTVRAAGTATVSEERIGGIYKVVYTWTTGVTDTAASGVSTKAYTGKVIKAYVVPDATDVPAANYDVALYDENGNDVLDGAGANANNSATTVIDEQGVVANDTLEISVTNASTTSAGIIYVFIERY